MLLGVGGWYGGLCGGVGCYWVWVGGMGVTGCGWVVWGVVWWGRVLLGVGGWYGVLWGWGRGFVQMGCCGGEVGVLFRWGVGGWGRLLFRWGVVGVG